MKTYTKIFFLLTQREKFQYIGNLFLAMTMGFVELINVASVLPFLAILANPDVIHSNAYMATAYRWSGAATDQEFLVLVGLAIFCLIIVGQSFRAFVTFQMINFARMQSHRLSTRLMERYLAQAYVWFLRRNTVSLRKTLLQEVGQAMSLTLLPSIQVVARTVIIFSLVTLLVVVDPVVAVVVATVLGVTYGLLIYLTRRTLTRIGRQRVVSNKKRFTTASNSFSMIKEIKLAGLESYFFDKFESWSFEFFNSAAKQKLLSDMPKYAFESFIFGGIILFILSMMSRSDGDFSAILPTLGIYAVATTRMFPAFQGLYKNLNQLKFGGALLDLVKREFEQTEDVTIPRLHREEQPIRLVRQLELENVVFAFPKMPDPVLNGLTMTIEANTTVGIVGGTGTGKTTTVDIILGLLMPQTGTIRVDGTVLDSSNIRHWQRRLGYVPQTITLLDESIRNNIAFGVPPSQIDDAAVERAARAAELHDFVVTELPDGYRTTVGNRGNRLSGGQRQRVGIARALYHEPDLLILDEATSALDNLTERDVIQSIHMLKKNMTVIMIAHRLSTVRNSDKIFLLEKGQVRSVGAFDTLYETDTEFQRLVDAQI